MTTYARIEARSAPLHSDFARDFLRRRFGDAVTDALIEAAPRFSHGPQKGLLKGVVAWDKVVRGGWVQRGGRGSVVYPGAGPLRVAFKNVTVLDEDANCDDAARITAIKEMLT